eukprot:CAMPEP_0113948380 /NCGR_PEP_ID=MMETSP1339-20121228/70068_1 /TAXON_ID=94617 /ORGANISM="Fibrocapsa japonica" /LENGTH=61 /DNA_ID=CAMNT_0000955425 /DNA_START=112 /DNA_END=294 /DNA_ORIENTATION=- /assembly_acc=CAM_ASM_000762
MAPYHGVPVTVHSDHCAKRFEGKVAANEEYFARNGEPLFSSQLLDLSVEGDMRPSQFSSLC